MFKKILALLIVAGIGYGIYYFVSDYLETKDAWKVEIINSSINVREESKVSSNQLATVYLGEIYVVEEFYDEDLKFVWYKIEYDKDKFGWIASSRDIPYVKEINNPNSTTPDAYVVDYDNPEVRFKSDANEDLYSTYDINSINYDHLEITEDSDYTITHKIYYEEEPTDSNTPQWWIEYSVIDEFDNSKVFLQRIEFEINPSIDSVYLFENR